MKNTLKLNPYFRLTARECLLNKVFDKFRDTKKERMLNLMYQTRYQAKSYSNSDSTLTKYQVQLEIDKPDVFNYDA
jgi:hypothetical protein